jgi:hypothetical protein
VPEQIHRSGINIIHQAIAASLGTGVNQFFLRDETSFESGGKLGKPPLLASFFSGCLKEHPSQSDQNLLEKPRTCAKLSH